MTVVVTIPHKLPCVEHIVTDPKYAAFTALDPFFDIVQQSLAGLVDGDHYFDTIANDAEFEFRYHFPGLPQTPHSIGFSGGQLP